MFLPLEIAKSRRRPIQEALRAQDFGHERWWHPVSGYRFEGADAAISERLMRDIERRLVGVAPWPDVPVAIARMHAPFANSQRNIAWCPTTFAEDDATHRATRAIARLLVAGADVAPADQNAFAAIVGREILEGSPDRYALVYTRLDDHRVRLAVDSATAPDFCTGHARPPLVKASTAPLTIIAATVEVELPPSR